jgi:hypothetical protein
VRAFPPHKKELNFGKYTNQIVHAVPLREKFGESPPPRLKYYTNCKKELDFVFVDPREI